MGAYILLLPPTPRFMTYVILEQHYGHVSSTFIELLSMLDNPPYADYADLLEPVTRSTVNIFWCKPDKTSQTAKVP